MRRRQKTDAGSEPRAVSREPRADVKPLILVVDDEPGVRSALSGRAARRGLPGRRGRERRGLPRPPRPHGLRRRPARRLAAGRRRPGDPRAHARAAGGRAGDHDLRPRQHRVGRARDQARGVRLHREAALAREDGARRAERAAAAAARGREPRPPRARRPAPRRWWARATPCDSCASRWRWRRRPTAAC